MLEAALAEVSEAVLRQIAPADLPRLNDIALDPAVMGFAVVVSFAYVLVNLAVDLVYLLIDPRIQGVN